MTRKKRLIITLISVIMLLAAGGTAAAFWLTKPSYNIPQKVLDQNAFSIFVPVSDSKWQVDTSATKYIESAGVLSLKFTRDGWPAITVTQQARPGAFDDIPNYYGTMLTKLHEYREIATVQGTVALTHPEELQGAQSAVGSSRGTLFFAHPDRDLTDDQWKEFFSNLKVLR